MACGAELLRRSLERAAGQRQGCWCTWARRKGAKCISAQFERVARVRSHSRAGGSGSAGPASPDNLRVERHGWAGKRPSPRAQSSAHSSPARYSSWTLFSSYSRSAEFQSLAAVAYYSAPIAALLTGGPSHPQPPCLCLAVAVLTPSAQPPPRHNIRAIAPPSPPPPAFPAIALSPIDHPPTTSYRGAKPVRLPPHHRHDCDRSSVRNKANSSPARLHALAFLFPHYVLQAPLEGQLLP